MRTLRKNQQSMKYSLQIGEVPVYNTDENDEVIYLHYKDDEGNIIYYLDENGNKIPSDTGEKEIVFSTPVEFQANIAMSGGESEAQEFGLSQADYEAVALYSNGEVPLVEGSLVWFESEPEYKYNGDEVAFEITNKDGEKETVYLKVPIETSADYRVIKISPSLSFTRAILKAITK